MIPLRSATSCREAEIFDIVEADRIVAYAPERLVVAGGDGTIGAFAELAGWLGVPLAVVPTGTANDFASAHDLPEDLREAAELAATGTHTRTLDLGHLADGQPFVNVASAGLASVAARRAQPFKHRLGPLAYAVGAVRAAATAHPLEATVRVDGEEVFAGACWQAIVAVSGAFGGGSGVAEADPRDGALDVVVLPAGSRAGLARRAWGLRTQTIAQQRGGRARPRHGDRGGAPARRRAQRRRRAAPRRARARDGTRRGVQACGAATLTPSRPRRLTS